MLNFSFGDAARKKVGAVADATIPARNRRRVSVSEREFMPIGRTFGAYEQAKAGKTLLRCVTNWLHRDKTMAGSMTFENSALRRSDSLLAKQVDSLRGHFMPH